LGSGDLDWVGCRKADDVEEDGCLG